MADDAPILLLLAPTSKDGVPMECRRRKRSEGGGGGKEGSGRDARVQAMSLMTARVCFDDVIHMMT